MVWETNNSYLEIHSLASWIKYWRIYILDDHYEYFYLWLNFYQIIIIWLEMCTMAICTMPYTFLKQCLPSLHMSVLSSSRSYIISFKRKRVLPLEKLLDYMTATINIFKWHTTEVISMLHGGDESMTQVTMMQ